MWRAQVVYVDTLFFLAVLSFAMDFLLLWATAKVATIARSWRRLALGSMCGTLYFILYYLSMQGIAPRYSWLQAWPVLILVSIVMLLLAFAPLPFRRLPRVLGFYYFIAVSSGGTGLAVGFALGWSVPLQLVLAIGAILVIAEMGWGVVQKSLWQRLYHVPVEIRLFDEQVRVSALLDTGNRLKDPFSAASVIVVELDELGKLVPEPIERALRQMSSGDLSAVTRLLTSSRWSSRFRIIPFQSLGNEHGLLVGFRPDRAVVTFDKRRLTLDGVIVGIYTKKLDPEGYYHALLPQEVLQVVAQSATDSPAIQTDTTQGGTSHAPIL